MADLASLAATIAGVLRSPPHDDAAIRVCGTTATQLPCDGVAMTAMTSDVGRETVFASDRVAGDFEKAQYTSGEGPSLVSFTTRRPVLVPDLSHRSARARWPGLCDQVAELPVWAVFCFPMRFGAISVGVSALYRQQPGPLTGDDLAFVLEAMDLTTLALLELREGSQTESLLDRWLAVDEGSRRQVHQATGMLIAQLGVSAEQAFARLRGYAFYDGRDIEQVAGDIVNRRLRLDHDPDPDLV